jgi:hypothetical protein
LYVVRPNAGKALIQFFAKGNRIYLAGVIRFALAVLLLLSVHACNLKWVIIAFGVLLILSSVLIFSLGHKKLAGLLDWAQRQRPLVLRIMGLITIALGGILLYSA